MIEGLRWMQQIIEIEGVRRHLIPPAFHSFLPEGTEAA
jgi:hypothetical protein